MYEPLDRTKKEIRVLELLAPEPPDDEIFASCQLTTVSLAAENPPFFAALSYVWGDGTATRIILLNGIKRRVAQNLAEALKRITRALRESQIPGADASVRVWADAICIKQDDVDERGHQIFMMGQIFSSAAFVFSYLGADPCIPLAFKILRTIFIDLHINEHDTSASSQSTEKDKYLRLLERRPELCRYEPMPGDSGWGAANSRIKALHEFMHLPYWSRMWIFQEIALARKLFFACEDDLLAFGNELILAIHYLRRLSQWCKGQISHPSPSPDSQNPWEDWIRLKVAFEWLVDSAGLMTFLVQRHILQGVTGPRRAAMSLRVAFAGRPRATDPRDYYYSIIGVAGITLEPNYKEEKIADQVCLDFASAYLQATRGSPWSLEFLRGAAGCAPEDRHRLPSWAPMYHLERGAMPVHISGDAYGGHEGSIFGSASPPLPSDLAALPEIRGNTLRVLGARLDVISSVIVPVTTDFANKKVLGAFLLGHCLRHGVVYSKTRKAISAATAVLATLVRNESGEYDFCQAVAVLRMCLPMGRHPFMPTVLRAFFTNEIVPVWAAIFKAHFDTAPPTLDESLAFEEVPYQLVTSLSILVQESAVLFETNEGYIGIGPANVQAGDEICILDGCIGPVILRPAGNQYAFVWRCFVLGLMCGEVRTAIDCGQAKPEVIELI